MKILLTEFITGGGMLDDGLPDSIAREGAMMLAALVRDFMRLGDGFHIAVTLDNRFNDLYELFIKADWYDAQRLSVEWVESDYVSRIVALSQNVDYVLPVAPESDQVLEKIAIRLSAQTDQKKAQAILSSAEVIRLCASKIACSNFLIDRGLPALKGYSYEEAKNLSGTEQSGAWVVKPDQAEGATNVLIYPDLISALTTIQEYTEQESAKIKLPNDLIFQPYIEGVHVSVSMICDQGEALILGINRQEIEIREDQFSLKQIEVNGLLRHKNELQPIAKEVAWELPELSGYIGLDLIIQAGQAYILEINPRLTTSYVGLAESLDENPAQLIIDWVQNRHSTLKNNNKRISYVDLGNT